MGIFNPKSLKPGAQLLIFVLACCVGQYSLATDKNQIKYASKRLATKPLSEMAKVVPVLNPSKKLKMTTSGKPVPGDGNDYQIPNKTFPLLKLKKRGTAAEQKAQVKPDAVRQSAFPGKRIPDTTVSFDGMPNVMGAVPPDTNGDVGPNHYVQTVNTAIAVWDKQGNQILEPTALNSLWTGLGGLCESTNRGDPIVLYDQMADRWLVSQFAFNDSTTDNRQCIAVSQTPDPTGAYYIYDFAYSTTHFNDYPKFGVWDNAYYMSVNQFVGDNYAGVGVVAFERNAMLSGANARQVKIDLAGDFPSVFSLLPADHDGVLLPPADSPNYFFSIQDDWFHDAPQDAIQIFRFDLDWNQPQAASFSLATEIPVAAMDLDIETSEILQPNGVSLDSLLGYAMYRLAYRNFGATASLVATHNVDADSAGQAGIRWYQIDIDNSNGDIRLNQQGTFAPNDGVDRWMSSIAMDAVGNIALGYNATSDTIHPSVYYSGRLVDDPAGEISQGEGIIVAGSGSQGVVNRSRWADYSSLSVDPDDDCTFWYTNEYYDVDDDDTLNWSTRIGSFKFAECEAIPTGHISGRVTDASSGEALPNIRVQAGGIATRTDAQGNYSLQLHVGSYDLSFGGYWYDSVQVSGIEVTADSTVVRNAALSRAQTTSVSGTVRDGSGKNWPLYARVTLLIPNSSDITLFTDPFTGQYETELVSGTAVPVRIEPLVVGYQETDTSILPVDNNGSFAHDFSVSILDDECTAPGYLSEGLFQSFEKPLWELGWFTEDINGSGVNWVTTAGARANVTGATGEAALIDSDAAGSITLDAALISPQILVGDLQNTVLTYVANYQTYSSGDNFDLDISVDGDRWQNILAWTGNHGEFYGPGEKVSVDLSPYLTDGTSFQLRWHYYNANNEWFAQIDNVALDHSCSPISGGSLVAGYVVDENTQLPLSEAKVTAVNQALSFIQGDDPGSLGALYYVFVNESNQEISATKSDYGTRTLEVAVQPNQLIREDLQIPAAQISLSSNSLELTVPQGAVRDFDITVLNTGNHDGLYRFFEINADKAQRKIPMQGRIETGMRYAGPKDYLKLNAKHIRDYRPPYVQPMAPGDVIESIDISASGFAFGVGFDQGNDSLWIGSLSTGGNSGNNKLQRYLLDGTHTEDTIDMKSILDNENGWFGDMAYNARTGTLWVTEVDNEFCIHEVDPESKALTGNSICPQGLASSQHGLAYDPVTDTYFSGSFNGGLIYRFKSDGEIVSAINVGFAVAGLAYHPISNKLYVSVSAEAPEKDIVVLDADNYDVLGGFDVMRDTDGDGVPEDVMTDWYQGGLALSCNGMLWVVDYSKMELYRIDVEEQDACIWEDIPWLNGYVGGEVAAGQSAVATIQVDTSELEIGLTYEAMLLVDSSDPYAPIELPVSVSVVDGVNGSVQFLQSYQEVEEEQVINISVERIDGSDASVSVEYTIIEGSAVNGTDFIAESGTLEWEDQDSDSKSIELDLKTVHSHKTFSIQLSNVQGGVTLGENSTIEVKILDKPKGSGSLPVWILVMLMVATFGLRQKLVLKN
ncbi:carboxypeptidase regulatory-like domain-containing protein [Aliikangiella sp. G2MR2-5]|uniref:carboxypeptidase regulatory-like domain-containing protein n=1 Tax=Aliikangiella sp. G2MR2-5 TaxID=2788943 RepID=UPI0018AA4090|nr:carboxypeptidase regulatory-like domain-containing protein [Aliikangiella sp. G2MR2-5]